MKPATKFNDQSADFGRLEERVKWHEKFGWGIASILAAAMMGMVTWWIPRESDTLREKIKADTAAQIEPLSLNVARLTGLVTLRQTGNVDKALSDSVDFAKPKEAIATVKAIVEQAGSERLIGQPQTLEQVNARIHKAVNDDPSLVGTAWTAQLAMIDFRSSLPVGENTATKLGPASGLLLMQRVAANGGIQELGGFSWSDTTFNNVEITYSGGPVVLNNVKFINCTFKMVYSKNSERIADLILAPIAVTQALA